jgi:hypothetical protein
MLDSNLQEFKQKLKELLFKKGNLYFESKDTEINKTFDEVYDINLFHNGSQFILTFLYKSFYIDEDRFFFFKNLSSDKLFFNQDENLEDVINKGIDNLNMNKITKTIFNKEYRFFLKKIKEL